MNDLLFRLGRWMPIDPISCVDLSRLYTFPYGQDFSNLKRVLSTWKERV